MIATGFKPVVLLVEDDDDDHVLFRRVVERGQYAASFHHVWDGQEAIDYLAGAPPYENRERFPLPHLMVVDLKMPRKDGFEFLAWWKERPELRTIRTVVFSGSLQPADAERAMELGASIVVSKPASLEEFREKAQEVFSYWSKKAVPFSQD